MSELLFLDADGTLLDVTGKVPESARKALKKAKEAGYKLILSTGRLQVEVVEELASLGFDGMILGAGAYVTVDGMVLHDEVLDDGQKSEIADFVIEHDVPAIWESNERLYANEHTKQALDQLSARLTRDGFSPVGYIYGLLDVVDHPEQTRAVKVSTFDSPVPVSAVTDAFCGYSVLAASFEPFSNQGCEIGLAHLSKGHGVKLIADHFGVSLADCIAIGDSDNDLEMFEACGLSYAMANGSKRAKEKADVIAPAINDDGIAWIIDRLLDR